MWNEFNLFFTMLNYFAVPTLLKFWICFCYMYVIISSSYVVPASRSASSLHSTLLLLLLLLLLWPRFTHCRLYHYPLIFYIPVWASHTWFHLCMLVTMFFCLPLENILSNIILHRFVNVVTNGKKGGAEWTN